MAEVGKIERYCVGPGDGKNEPVIPAKDNAYGVDAINVGGNLYSLESGVGGQNGFLGKQDNIGRG